MIAYNKSINYVLGEFYLIIIVIKIAKLKLGNFQLPKFFVCILSFDDNHFIFLLYQYFIKKIEKVRLSLWLHGKNQKLHYPNPFEKHNLNKVRN